LPPSPASPGPGCPQLHRPAATGSAAKVSHLHSNLSASRRTHDARHTAATVLLILGVPERAVMGLMGWSTTAMAARYQHITGTIRNDVAERVGGLIWGAAAGE
ncbi:MAG: tyrosine-type recombinase/integrase, partial [Pseudonocardiales bacterium]|nr:tyrosine-type recombinase/integrase [Pseudonocardiales bacterium]